MSERKIEADSGIRMCADCCNPVDHCTCLKSQHKCCPFPSIAWLKNQECDCACHVKVPASENAEQAHCDVAPLQELKPGFHPHPDNPQKLDADLSPNAEIQLLKAKLVIIQAKFMDAHHDHANSINDWSAQHNSVVEHAEDLLDRAKKAESDLASEQGTVAHLHTLRQRDVQHANTLLDRARSAEIRIAMIEKYLEVPGDIPDEVRLSAIWALAHGFACRKGTVETNIFEGGGDRV